MTRKFRSSRMPIQYMILLSFLPILLIRCCD